jgi:type I restriction enzyme M protein
MCAPTDQAMSLSTTIKAIQDIMRKDAGVDGDAQRIGQLAWMLFLKMFDDQEQELEITKDDYQSPIPKHLRWINWAADPEGTGTVSPSEMSKSVGFV